MGFPDFELLGKKTTEQSLGYITGGLVGFSGIIKNEKILRAHVVGSPAYGHAAATVSIIRRLAAPADSNATPGFGYVGTIQVCADMTTKIDGKTIKEKLLELMPELKGADSGTIDKVTIDLIDLEEEPKLDLVLFGFCGADDWPNYLTEMGILKSLNVAAFLLVQPYLYKLGSTFGRNPLQAPGNLLFFKVEDDYKFFNLDTFGTTAPYHIADRGFTQPIRMLSKDDWEVFIKLTGDPVKLLVQIMQRLTAEKVTKEFDLVPLYGINYPSDTGFRAPASHRLALLLSTYYKTLSAGANIKRPLIINFGRYIPADDLAMSLANVMSLAQGGRTAQELLAEQTVNFETNEQAKTALQQIINNARNRGTALQVPDTSFFKVVDYKTIATEQKLEELLNWQRGDKKRVLMIQGDRVPPLVFEYVMKLGVLPSVFEGNNTAMVAINAGNPYLFARSSGDLTGSTRYPQGSIQGSSYNRVAELFQKIANRVQADFATWPTKLAESANVRLAEFIKMVYVPNNETFEYFGSVKQFYDNKLNDKFNVAVAFSYGMLTAARIWPSLVKDMARTTFAEIADLAQLFQTIQQEITDKGYVDLLADILPSGGIHDYLSNIAGNFTVTDPIVTDEKDSQQQIIKVILTGTTRAFDTTTHCTIAFTIENNELTCEAGFQGADTWLLNGVPWIVFEAPTFSCLSTDGQLPPSGKVVAKLQNTDLQLSVALPDATGVAIGTASFETPVSVSSLAAFAGGVNLQQYVPDAIAKLANIGVKDVSFNYNVQGKSLDRIILNIGSTEDWEIMPKLQLKQLNLQILIDTPGDLQNREVTAILSGNLLIGEDPAGPVFAMTATIPELNLSGQLDGPGLSLDTLIGVFWNGATPQWPAGKSPVVSSLVMGYGVKSKNYNLSVAVDLNWPITINGTDILTVNAVSLYIFGGTGWATGGLSGSLTVLPDSANIGLILSADYLGNNNGWRFASKQTTGYISLIELFTFYLPNDWKPDPNNFDIRIDGLSITIETISNSWEFAAKTYDAIKIPYTDIEITGNLKVGYKGSNPALALAAPGYYGNVNALITWNGVDLTLFYNFDPAVKAYGVSCVVAGVTIAGEIKTQNNKSVATLGFSGSPTVGGIIETFITWATGQQFGLAAPWSILNDIPLPNVSLTYDFTAQTVSFDVKIGPIELGFATIKGIKVSYNSNDPDPNNNGVIVTLEFTSSFGNVKPWNAAKPEETPAPSGQGNKYLDLRMLAMGQHVSIPDLNKAGSVKEAIEYMEKMPIPQKGKKPPVSFDPNSSWLIGMDFGVLKIEDPKSNNAFVLATNPGYLLTLQMVFNDPNLYGLRIALAGEAAKVFAGLDFQIMYKKISDSVGVYMAEIALPDTMRKIKMGEFNITLPVFGIQLYTNGDFQVDIGFPWKQDFSRSLTFQALIITPIGVPIPVMGSVGLYFGKLSSATTNIVPQSDKGTFNPVLVFGYGMQFGLGYDFEEGPLKAGFSLTIVAILEGVLAKWNPYALPAGPSNNTQVETAYYFWIRGTVGIIGRLYGSIDFSIIKASLTVDIRVIAQITFTPYEPILLSITASVDVSLKVRISLGIFKINVSFSFSARISQSITLPAIGGTAPWANKGLPNSRLAGRLPAWYTVAHAESIQPVWNNLQKAANPIPLKGYLGLGLTMAGDAATTTAQQLPCYVSMLFIESMLPPQHDRLSCIQSAFENKEQADTDSSFERLCKMILRWNIAALQSGPVTSEAVDELVITDLQLKQLLDYLSDRSNPVPLPADAIDAFMSGQFQLTVSASQQAGSANGTFFPAPDNLHFSVPAYGSTQALSYSYGDYNSLSQDYIRQLAEYFDELAVNIQQQDGEQAYSMAPRTTTSMGSFMFCDYFLLLSRQMIQAARNSLKDLKYFLQQGDTPQQIVSWVHENGQSLYDIGELFTDNASVPLTAGNKLSITNSRYLVQSGDTFQNISQNASYAGAFTGAALALFNSDTKNSLQSGIAIEYPSKPAYAILPGQSLSDIATALSVSVQQLVDNTNILGLESLLLPVATIEVPAFDYTIQAGDTLHSIALRYGITPAVLAASDANGQVADLFDRSATPAIDIVQPGQFKVGKLLEEIQATQGLQHLSGMASRYYMAGLRLPTEGITPQYPGMWVQQNGGSLTLPPYAGLYALTGQQFPIPASMQQGNYDITYSISSDWLVFDGNASQVVISIVPGQISAQQIAAVTAYATNNRLDVETNFLGTGDTFNSQYTTYPFTSEINWNCPAPIPMPYGNFPAGNAALRWWQLPDTLLGLHDATHAIDPRVQVLLGQYDNASGSMINTPIDYYGYATQVAFGIRKIPAIPNSPATTTTYEITGADGANADILEKIVTGIGNDDSLIAGLSLAFAVDPNGSTLQGLQSDDARMLTMGIAKVNLSTDTRPDIVTRTYGLAAQQLQLLNTPSQFINLLWEAGITRAGGFYLYYNNAQDSSGLPDRIFNDRGEATIYLLVMYAVPSDTSLQNNITNYMNTLVTAEAFDTSQAVLFAQANPIAITLASSATQTLQQLAFDYYGNVGDVAADNKDLTLRNGITIQITEGVYEVGPSGPNNLNAIAAWFNTTVAAIQAANPLRTQWPDPLPLFTSILLPQISETISGSTTLNDLANFYQQNISSLAAFNQQVTGIFADGQTILIQGGPSTRSATVPAGVVALEASRQMPDDIPDDPSDPNYAKYFLQHTYSLLTYQLIENEFFTGSNISLPVGPTTAPADPDNFDKLRAPKTLQKGDDWKYKLSLPYSRFSKQSVASLAGLPDPGNSPYRGIGDLLCVHFAWQDYYGNQLITTLSQPMTGDGSAILDQPPVLTGYTDQLMGLNQWPGVSTAWLVQPGADEQPPQLQLPFNFDNSAYQGLNGIEAVNSTTVTAAFTVALDLQSATTISNYALVQQLAPGNSEEHTITINHITLNPDHRSVTISVDNLEMSDDLQITLTFSNVSDDNKVIDPDRSLSFSGVARFFYSTDPAAPSTPVTGNAQRDLQSYQQLWYQLTDANGIRFSIDTTLLQQPLPLTQQQFNGLVQNWIASIYLFLADRAAGNITVPVPPAYSLVFPIELAQLNSAQIFKLALSLIIERTGGSVAGDFETTGGIKQVSCGVSVYAEKTGTTYNFDAFARQFEEALQQDEYVLRVATGVDRTDSLDTERELWAVKKGLQPGTGISYEINDTPSPAIFAPRPISNVLETYAQIPIYDFDPKTGISPTPSRYTDFSGIDMDQWARTLFTSIDTVLSPTYTAAAQLVDKQLNTQYYAGLINNKAQLADIVKKWMVPVFENESADSSGVQEAFRQLLLVQLGNAYTTNVGVGFTANVAAGTPDGIAPRLYGAVTQIIPAEASDANYSDAVSITAAKLDVAPATNAPINCLVTSPEIVKNESGSVLPYLDLDLKYGANTIEHQISQLSPGNPYLASSWLHFLTGDGNNSFVSPLGKCRVPLILRSFPATPAMVAQKGVAAVPSMAGVDFDTLLNWNYTITYSQQFHYPQDILSFNINFNVRDAISKYDLNGDYPLFAQLAEFVTVLPAVQDAFNNTLARIDAQTTDQQLFTDGGVALQSYTQLVSKIINASTNGSNGLAMAGKGTPRISNEALPYNFELNEGSQEIDGVQAFVVSISDAVPVGIAQLEVQLDNCDTFMYTGDACTAAYCFYFKDKDTGAIITDAEGQQKPARTIVLEQLNILARQDAETLLQVKRNQKLVPGVICADPFVYTTGQIGFANSCHPMIDSNTVIDISTLNAPGGSHNKLSLSGQLTNLFSVLLQHNTQPVLSFQMTCNYAYTVNAAISNIVIPVLIQPMIDVQIFASHADADTELEQMISNWANGIRLWWSTYQPNYNRGSFNFELTVFSNLTEQPLPLLRLHDLTLGVQYITDLNGDRS